MAPLDVNPGELSAAGDKLAGDGGALAAALAALTGGISGVNAGHDGAGVKFGSDYVNTGKKVMAAGAAAINACRRMGYGIKMSAYNYALANAMSVPGGGPPSLPIPPCPAPEQAPGMSSPFGPGIAEPVLWGVVEGFIGEFWPDGDPASLRAAAQAWTTYGGALTQAAGDVSATKGLYAAQHLPEADLMSGEVDKLSGNITALAGQCGQIAAALTSFANKVEETQNAIRDLLNRLNPMSGSLIGLAVTLFQDGDPWATIKAIAHDIKVVLGHMKDEADAAEWAFQQMMNGLDSATDGLERWVTKEFPAVAPVVNGYIDIENGVIHSVADAVHGISELNPTRFAYDPKGAFDTWKGMVDTLGMGVPPILLAQLATNPQGVLDRVKALVDAKDWSGDHPLRGLGHNIGDVAQLFIPGVGEAKPAAAAAETTARVGEAGAGGGSRLAAAGHDGATVLGHAGGAGGDIASQAGKVAGDLDQIRAPTVEPPRPPSGPEPPPTRSTLPEEHPGGPAPPSQPGLPAAEVKPTAVEPAPPVGHGPGEPGAAGHPPASDAVHPPSSDAVHPPSSEPVHPPSSEPVHPPSSEPVHPQSSEPAPGGHSPGEPVSAPRAEPSPQGHVPGEVREAPLGESPAARAPGDVVESPHTEPAGTSHPVEAPPAEPTAAPHSQAPADGHAPAESPAPPHTEPAGEPSARPPAEVHPVDAVMPPVHPVEPGPAAAHAPPVAEAAAKPAAAASGEAARTGAQAADAAKAPPVAPADAAGPRSVASEVKSAPADGAHGPTDAPAGLTDRPAPAAGEKSPPPQGHSPEGDPGGNHLPDNENDPFTQADRDHGIAEEAREPGSSNEPTDRCANGEPVDMATGEYFLPMTDLELPGVLPLVLVRQHRSQYRRGVWFGPSWTSTFDARVVVTADGVTTVDGDGTMLSFAHPSLDAPQQPRHGRNWLLFKTTDGGYRLFSQDTERSYHFDPKSGLNGTDLAVGVVSISAITDRHENRISFHYTENGIPAAVAHSGGYRIDVQCDGARITGYDLASPPGVVGVPVRRFGYLGGDLVTVTDGCGATTSFAYDRDHQMVGWTDSVGAHYQNVYDTEGRIASQQGTDGVWAGTFDFVSTADGLVSTLTDAYGDQTAYEFDADLRPRRVLDPEGRLTSTEFNRWRDPVSVTEPSGAVTRYEYTEGGDIAAVTDALGSVTRFEYASPRHPSRIVREGHSPVVLAYDARGNVIEASCDGASRRFEYDAAGALVATVDEEGRRTDITVNAAGLPVRITDADGNATVIDYDGFGRAVAMTDPHGHRTTVARDAEGRVLRRVAADGTERSWVYDGEGNCVSQVDEVGARTGFEYGYYDKVTAQIAPDGSRTEYRYDRARRLVEVVNADGLIWRYTYFGDGRLSSETDFNGATTSYRYDAAGRLAEKTNAEGQAITYTYDALGRPLAETTSAADAFGDEVTQFRYGADGELAAAVNPHGTGTYSQDRRSRVRTATWNDQTVTTSFNAAGQLVGVLSPSGVRTDYAYDSRGVLSGLIAAGRVVNLGSDAAGWITRTEVGRTSVQREFDPLGRLVAQSWSASTEGRLFLGPTPAPADQVLTGASYVYRPDGALSARIVDRVETAYRLDAVGRVDATTIGGVVAERFGYDATNNIRTAVAAGAPDRPPARWDYRGTLLLDDGRSHFTYDRAGRLIRTVTRRLNRKPDVWHYRWDAYDRLRSATTPDGNTWTYGYDIANRRTHKANPVAGETVQFSWAADQLVEQASTGAVTTWSYLPGAVTPLAQVHTTPDDQPSVDVPLQIGGPPIPAAAPEPSRPSRPSTWAQPDIDRAFYALVTDHLGTPTHLIDPTTATVAGHATTNLWGRSTWTGAASTPLRFPGQYHDAETGWHYNRYRYYQPDTGRYTTPDPLGLAPAPNPHTYPANPTVATDPLGLMPCEPVHETTAPQYLYRGIVADHPGFADGLKGNVYPRDPASTVTGEEHNLGNTKSPFTSWTRDIDVAKRYAGEDGIILRTPAGKVPGRSYEWSPDVFYESEILIRGPVEGAERIK